MPDNRAGLFESIALGVARWLAPLRDMLGNNQVLDLLAELGAQLPPELAADASFSASVNLAFQPFSLQPDLIAQLLKAADGGDFTKVAKAADDLKNTIAAAKGGLHTHLVQALIDATNAGLTGFTLAEMQDLTSGLAGRLIEWSVITSIEEVAPELSSVLDLFQVINRSEQQVGSTDPRRPQYTLKHLDLGALPAALRSPLGVLRSKYGFGEAGFDGTALLARLGSLLSYAGLPSFNDTSSSPPKLDVLFADVFVNTAVSPPGLALRIKVTLDQTAHSTPDGLSRDLVLQLVTPPGGVLTIEPSLKTTLVGPASSSTSGELSLHVTSSAADPSQQVVLIGRAEGSRLELQKMSVDTGVVLTWDGSAAASRGTFAFGIQLDQLHLLITAPDGDGFLGALLPSKGLDARFDLGMRLGPSGVAFNGSASLTINLPLHLTLGPIAVEGLAISVGVDDGAFPIELGASLKTSFGPFDAVIEGIGVSADLSFPADGNGNLGPVQVDLGFQWPTGVGLSVETGGFSGGGFLFIDREQGRYAGALELSVYGIAVKAFGLIETKLPDGSKGFSFIVVISAEFSPVQLGYGFTLLGVGGLLGVNRTLNADGLGRVLRDGSLGTLLFPSDPVADAPTIIQNISTVFPAAKGHYVFGPMAKLGWGTPTLVHGDLGIVLELPGPRLAVLGVVRAALPSESAALIRLQMAVAGVLDFPGRRFSIDASIYDSYVGSFSIGGDMAFRLAFGGTPNFALAVGGFNPSYKAPPSFPELRRVTIDLGVNGNPSLTAYGYFALTPNTAQLGAGIDLRASGAGIRLEGHAGFDAIFIFSPFSFTATMDAGMSVKFHGVGLGVHFHGELSGPTPWHINGRVCVSVLFWDACLGVDITFGESRRAELPAMDPWFGPDSPPAGAPTLSLKAAIEDAHNWSASATAGGETVVTLRQRASDAPALVDPMGAAALRQKVVPLGQKITKFGEFKPSGHDEFKVASVTIAGEEQTREPILDDFVPSHFKAMSNAERLSSKPYDQMQAGFSLGPPHMAAVGAIGEKEVVYETQLLDGNRQRVQPQPPDYPLTRRHLLAMLARSATALEGVRRAGIGRYVDPTAPTKVRLGPELYVVATSCSLVPNLTLTGGSAVSRTAATLSIEFDVSINPGNAGGWAAVPAYEVPR